MFALWTDDRVDGVRSYNVFSHVHRRRAPLVAAVAVAGESSIKISNCWGVGPLQAHPKAVCMRPSSHAKRALALPLGQESVAVSSCASTILSICQAKERRKGQQRPDGT